MPMIVKPEPGGPDVWVDPANDANRRTQRVLYGLPGDRRYVAARMFVGYPVNIEHRAAGAFTAGYVEGVGSVESGNATDVLIITMEPKLHELGSMMCIPLSTIKRIATVL